MAQAVYPAAGKAVTSVLEKIGAVLLETVREVQAVRGQIEKVRKELRLIQALLRDLDSKCKRNNVVTEWLNQVREIADRIATTIDTFRDKINEENRAESSNWVGRKFTKAKTNYKTYKLGLHDDLEDIIEQLDWLYKRRTDLRIEDLGALDPEDDPEVATRRQLIHNKEGPEEYVNNPFTPTEDGSSKKLVFLGNVPRVYDLEDLLGASAEVLGKGTFGTTYKMVLETGPVVVVKRLKNVNLPEREFRDKVGELGSMQSVHLVPIEAYYYSKDEKLIVYEYVSMGSLSSLLHGNKGSGHMPLGFEARASIALSAARGIEYIHSTGPKASHGNIKSSNVLLSGSDRARISHQGLAQLVTTPTLPNCGSGYRAPEVTDVRKISQKADVYSFGVLLMELLTGKAPGNTVVNDEGVDLPQWVQSVLRDEWKAEVFDLELVKQQYAEQEMVQLLQLAIDCTEQDTDRRLTMAEVARRIDEIFLSVSGGSFANWWCLRF